MRLEPILLYPLLIATASVSAYNAFNRDHHALGVIMGLLGVLSVYWFYTYLRDYLRVLRRK